MTSRNNDGMDPGLALAGAATAALSFFLFAALAFIAAILTVLALLALIRPLRLWKWSVEPETARMFLGAGILGAVTFVAFTGFAAVLFDFAFPWKFMKYIVIGGYIAGAFCIDNLFTPYIPEDEKQENIIPAPLVQNDVLPLAPPPFRFASWDDEEDRT